jgi:nucleotide-binding universal stress UspA family protein
MSNPIVVGVALRDDDHAPLALARDLARFTGAPLALVHVYPGEPPSRLPSTAYEEAMRERAMAALEQAAEPLRAECEAKLHAEASSSPVRGLHDAAAALDAALLVAGSSHRGRLGRVMPGGVGERLLHSAPCAVALAPRGYTGADDGIRRIGVAFIDTPDGRDALDAAALMAVLGDGELSTFTVLEPPHIGPAPRRPAGSRPPTTTCDRVSRMPRSGCAHGFPRVWMWRRRSRRAMRRTCWPAPLRTSTSWSADHAAMGRCGRSCSAACPAASPPPRRAR